MADAKTLFWATVSFVTVLGFPPKQKQVRCKDDFAIISSSNTTYLNHSEYPRCYSFDRNPCPQNPLMENDVKICHLNGDYPGYHALNSLPGHYRDDCFLEACCQCGGGKQSESDDVCYDQDVGVADLEGYSCKHYNSNKVSCTVERADSNFNPMDLCCKCGGGQAEPAKLGLRGRLTVLQHVEWFMHTLAVMSWVISQNFVIWIICSVALAPLCFRVLPPAITDYFIIITTSYCGLIYLLHILTLPLLGLPRESEKGKGPFDHILFPSFPHFGPLHSLQATRERKLKDLFAFLQVFFMNLLHWDVTQDQDQSPHDATDAQKQEKLESPCNEKPECGWTLAEMVAIYSLRMLRNFVPLSLSPYGFLLGFMVGISSALVLLACIIMEGILMGVATLAHKVAQVTLEKPQRRAVVQEEDEEDEPWSGWILEILMDWILPDMAVALKLMLTFFLDFLILFSIMSEMAYLFPNLPLPSFDIDLVTVNIEVPGWSMAVFKWFIGLFSWFQLPEVVFRCVSFSALSAAFYLYFAAMSISVILSSDIISCVYDRQNRFETRRPVHANSSAASADGQSDTESAPCKQDSRSSHNSAAPKRDQSRSSTDTPQQISSFETINTVTSKVQRKFSLESLLLSGKETICKLSTYVIWQVVTLVANSLSVYIIYMWQSSFQRQEARNAKDGGLVRTSNFLAGDDECTDGMHWLSRCVCLYLAFCTLFFCLRVFTGNIYENDAWILTAAMLQTERLLTRENLWRFVALMRLCFWTYWIPFASLGLKTAQMKRMRDLFYEKKGDCTTMPDDHEHDELWKLSEKGLEKLVKLTLLKGDKWSQRKKELKELENQVLNLIVSSTTDWSFMKGIEQWNDVFSGRREIVHSMLGLFIDDNAADDTFDKCAKSTNAANADEMASEERVALEERVETEIRKTIEANHDTDIFNALAIDRFNLHLFLGAYIRAQKRREEKGRYWKLRRWLKHALLLPLGVMDHEQIATAHVEERCIMWRAQIEQVTKSTGLTLGITVFAIPLVGPIMGKVIQYLNEQPVLLFVPEDHKAADCSLRGGDASDRPKTLEEQWKETEKQGGTLHKVEKEVQRNTSDIFTAEVHLKDRVLAPEWRQKGVFVCSVLKAAILVWSMLVPSSVFLCTACVFPIAWVQSWLTRKESVEWEKRFDHDHQVVIQNNEWKKKYGKYLVGEDDVQLGMFRV